MEILRKTMARSEWKRVTQRRYEYLNVKDDKFDGAVGLIEMLEVRGPLTVNFKNDKIKIVDKGYKCLQFAFRDKFYWLTVMLDETDKITEYYFDVTCGNYIEPDGASWFYDLFLDVVVDSGGRISLLDEDELSEALAEKNITHEQYDLAVETAKRLMGVLEGRVNELEAFCLRYYSLF